MQKKDIEIIKFLVSVYQATNSLHEYTKQVWSLIEGRPFQDNWHIQAINEHLEAVSKGEISNLIINVPPRTMKTTTVGVIWPTWEWCSRPETQFLYFTASDDMVNKVSGDSKSIIQSDFYKSRWPHVKIAGYQDSKTHFKNINGGFRMSHTINGNNTGKGGHILIIDDPNVMDESETIRESIIQTFLTVLANRINDPSKCCRIIMQQRYNRRDLSGFILSGESASDFTHLMLPMEFEKSRRCVTVPLASTNGKPWEDPRQEDGELLWPTFHTRESYEKTKRLLRAAGGSMATMIIAGQYQQRPSAPEGNIIKKDWFPWWKSRRLPTIEHVIQSWDTAFKDKKDSAYSACITLGLFYDDKGVSNVILLSVWKKKVLYPALRRAAVKLYKDYRDTGDVEIEVDGNHVPDEVIIEDKSSGSGLIQDMREAGLYVTPFIPNRYGSKTGDHDARVHLISHLIENGRVWLPAVGPEFTSLRPFAQDFLEDVATFPSGESNDVVDALTQALIIMKARGMLKNSADEKQESFQEVRLFNKVF